MSDKRRSFVPGIILILIGLSLFMHQLNPFFFGWDRIYPIILLVLAITLISDIIRKRKRNKLFWGIVLFVVGGFFLIRNYGIIPFYYPDEYWPIFLLSFGLAFFTLFILKPEDWGLLIPSSIFLFLGTGLIIRSLRFHLWGWSAFFETYWPVILIIIGMGLFATGVRRPFSNKI